MNQNRGGMTIRHTSTNNLKKTKYWTVTRGWQNHKYYPTIAKPKPYKELGNIIDLIESGFSS